MTGSPVIIQFTLSKFFERQPRKHREYRGLKMSSTGEKSIVQIKISHRYAI